MAELLREPMVPLSIGIIVAFLVVLPLAWVIDQRRKK